MTYLADPDVTIHCGDCLTVLEGMPDESVHACITSPPFFGLRSYLPDGHPDKPLELGLESSPQEWCDRLVSVFRQVRRVLRRDGTLWLEVGDAYATHSGSQGETGQRADRRFSADGLTRLPIGFKPKDQILAPHMLAMALRDDGWWLRSTIIFARPNPMPESVTDRPTTSHSYVFLLARSGRYFYDADAIREPAIRAGDIPGGTRRGCGEDLVKSGWGYGEVPSARNARSVWTIATEPQSLAVCAVCDAYWPSNPPRKHCGQDVVGHYAAFPQALVERCILAGTSERGCCPECGAPWVREVETSYGKSPKHGAGSVVRGRGEPTSVNGWAGEATPRLQKNVVTLGWRATCQHGHEPAPCTILDPFLGTGTVALVARRLGRHAVGIELKERYAFMAACRLGQQSLLAGEIA